MGNKTYHRPRDTHHQVRGHPVTPRNHLHANQTPRTRSQRRSGGVCAEGEPVLRPTLSPSRQTPAVSEAETHTATPPPCGPSPACAQVTALPLLPEAGASSPPPSLALPRAWAACSGAGQQTGGSQLKPSREPGSRGSPGPPRRAGWALRPSRPGSGWQLGPALAGVELGCGSNPGDG